MGPKPPQEDTIPSSKNPKNVDFFVNDGPLYDEDVDFSEMNTEIDEDEKLLNDTVAKTRASIIPKRPTPKAERKWCQYFPCCLKLPLEIGIQILCVLDLIYCILSLVLWSTFLGMDLFAHKLSELNQTDRFRPPDNSGPVIGDPFETSTTTAKPPWTLRTETTEIPKYDLDVVDSDILSKQYSKIARITVARHEAIERACGHHYLIKYLFMHELMQTREIWQDFIWTAIIGELIFLLTAVLTLMCVCCFIEHRGAKLLVMILWWLEWIPIFLHYDALIRSQSKRLCILENASAYIKGQLFFLIFLVIRAMMFKPYQLLVHFCYIKELLVYGYLKDESINSIEESQYAQKYFQPFYDLEEDRESGNVDAYKNTDTTVSVGFDTIIPAEVANVQNKVMTNQDDPFSIRNQEIIAVQSGKIEQNIKSVRHF